jgi:hypothetical protein
MRDTRPDDYTFEIIAFTVLFFALAGVFGLGFLIFYWLF